MDVNQNAVGAGRGKRNISQLVRITAVVVIVMFVLYFVVTLNNMSNISHRIEDRKDGAYPVSIAAGHVETDLSQILSVMKVIAVMDSVSPSFDGAADVGGQSASQSAELHTFHFETVRNDIQEITANMREQVSVMTANAKTDQENIQELAESYDKLVAGLGQAFEIWNRTPGDRTQVQSYIETDVIPLLEHALQVDNAIIDTTTDDIEDVYTSVLDSIQQTVIFSLLLIVATFLAMFIYIALLNRKELHEAMLSKHLKEALEAAQSANAAKSSFLSNISHDIRTPLNAIIGLTTIAEDNIDDQVRIRQCLGQITTSSNHLLHLINDVLDMNRIESGKITLACEAFSIPELMSELSTINETQIAEKGIRAQFELKDIKHKYVVGDPTRIRQILLNLTSNSIKYTHSGDSLEVVFAELPSAKEGFMTLKITVADTGIGMQKDFLEYIFEPFERERNETTDFTEGTGLGMAITKNLVTMMGGTISVESQLGEGTLFTVILPLEIAKEAVTKETKVSNAKTLAGRVLIVEDNELNMEIATELIKKMGPEVQQAVDGIEAVEMVEGHPAGYYDVIFMDWQMPRMNGIDATKTLVKYFQDENCAPTPIVAMTANAFNDNRREALAAGMEGFLAKPINVQELKETLAKYLGD